MENMIKGWVLGTFHLGNFPELYNLVAAEVEQIFEDNNIKSRNDKIGFLGGDRLTDIVREYHNSCIWNTFDI